MTREFNNPPDEQPDDNFFQELEENFSQLGNMPAEETVDNPSKADAHFQAELDYVDPEENDPQLKLLARMEEDPVPAVHEGDIWDFKEEFDGRPVREIVGGEKEMIGRSFRGAHSRAFERYGEYSEPSSGGLSGVKLELTYPLPDGDEIRTELGRKENVGDPENPRLDVVLSRWSEGHSHEVSVYLLTEKGSLRRTDNPFGDKHERIEEIRSKEPGDLTFDEIIEAHKIGSESAQRIEMERQLGLNNRPIGLNEAITVSAIIRQSKPLNSAPEAE